MFICTLLLYQDKRKDAFFIFYVTFAGMNKSYHCLTIKVIYETPCC